MAGEVLRMSINTKYTINPSSFLSIGILLSDQPGHFFLFKCETNNDNFEGL